MDPCNAKYRDECAKVRFSIEEQFKRCRGTRITEVEGGKGVRDFGSSFNREPPEIGRQAC